MAPMSYGRRSCNWLLWPSPAFTPFPPQTSSPLLPASMNKARNNPCCYCWEREGLMKDLSYVSAGNLLRHGEEFAFFPGASPCPASSFSGVAAQEALVEGFHLLPLFWGA